MSAVPPPEPGISVTRLSSGPTKLSSEADPWRALLIPIYNTAASLGDTEPRLTNLCPSFSNELVLTCFCDYDQPIKHIESITFRYTDNASRFLHSLPNQFRHNLLHLIGCHYSGLGTTYLPGSVNTRSLSEKYRSKCRPETRPV